MKKILIFILMCFIISSCERTYKITTHYTSENPDKPVYCTRMWSNTYYCYYIDDDGEKIKTEFNVPLKIIICDSVTPYLKKITYFSGNKENIWYTNINDISNTPPGDIVYNVESQATTTNISDTSNIPINQIIKK